MKKSLLLIGLVPVGVGLVFAAPAQAYVKSPAAAAAELIVMSDPAIAGYATATVTAAEAATVTVGTTQAVVGAGVLAGAAVAAGGLSIAAGGLDAFTWTPETGFIPSGGSGQGEWIGPAASRLLSQTTVTSITANTVNVVIPPKVTGEDHVRLYAFRGTPNESDFAALSGDTNWNMPWGTSPGAVVGTSGQFCDGSLGNSSTTATKTDSLSLLGCGTGDPYLVFGIITQPGPAWQYGALGLDGGTFGTPETAMIRQTLVCETSSGGLYTRSAEVPADLPEYQLGGLLCDPGDWAYDYSLEVVTGTETKTVLDSPNFGQTWQTMPVDQKSDLLSPGNTTQLTQEADGSTSTDVIVGGGSGNCSFGWSDVLTGGVFLKGLSCAFVPSETYYETQTQTVTQAWESSAVGTFTNAAIAVPMNLATMGSTEGGCEGPTFSIPLGSMTQDVQPLNACEAPMSTVAAWVKVVTTIVLVITGVVFVAYPILRALGMPQLRRSGGDSDGE